MQVKFISNFVDQEAERIIMTTIIIIVILICQTRKEVHTNPFAVLPTKSKFDIPCIAVHIVLRLRPCCDAQYFTSNLIVIPVLFMVISPNFNYCAITKQQYISSLLSKLVNINVFTHTFRILVEGGDELLDFGHKILLMLCIDDQRQRPEIG